MRHDSSEIAQEAKKFHRGGSVFHQCGNIVVTSWRDNKVVNVASTLASPTDLTTVQRKQKDGTRIDVECPLCVALYNLCDQLSCAVEVQEELQIYFLFFV